MGCNCCKTVKSYMIDPNGSVNVISSGHLNNGNNQGDYLKKTGFDKDSPFVVSPYANHKIKAFDNVALEDDVSSPESHVIKSKQYAFSVHKESCTAEHNERSNTITCSVCTSESSDTLYSISNLEKEISETDLSDAAIQLTDSVESILSDTQMEVVSQQQDMGYDSEIDEGSGTENVSQGQSAVQKSSNVSDQHTCEQHMESPLHNALFPQNHPQHVHLSLTNLGNATLLSQADTLDSTYQAEVGSSFDEITPALDIAEGNKIQKEPRSHISALAHDGQINMNISSSQITHGFVGEAGTANEEDPDVLEALAVLEAAMADEDDY